MTVFNNVTVVKKANVYFDGKVISRTVLFDDGTKKTLGFMFPGDYTFDTADKEIMEILDGELDVKLPGRDEWVKIVGGESFEIPANAEFSMKVTKPADYCCSYLK